MGVRCLMGLPSGAVAPNPLWGSPAAASWPVGRVLRRGWAPPSWAPQWPCTNLPKARPVCPQSKSLDNQFGECLKRFCQVFAFASLSPLGCSPPAHPSPAVLYASDGDGRRGKMRLKSSLLPFGDFVIWLLGSWPLGELVT